MNGWIVGVTAILTAAGCWSDLRTMTIPNRLTVGFAVGGLIVHALLDGRTGVTNALLGCAAGALPLSLLYRLKGIGAGDVKWFGAFGMWAGAGIALQLLLGSILLAGLFSALLLTLRLPGLRRWGSRLPWPWGRHPALPGRGAVFPFMLAVAPGYAWLVWRMGNWAF